MKSQANSLKTFETAVAYSKILLSTTMEISDIFMPSQCHIHLKHMKTPLTHLWLALTAWFLTRFFTDCFQMWVQFSWRANHHQQDEGLFWSWMLVFLACFGLFLSPLIMYRSNQLLYFQSVQIHTCLITGNNNNNSKEHTCNFKHQVGRGRQGGTG